MNCSSYSDEAPKFVDKYGENVFELEALAPDVLQELLTDAIDDVIDIDAFNSEMQSEHDDSVWLAARRKVLCGTLVKENEREGEVSG